MPLPHSKSAADPSTATPHPQTYSHKSKPAKVICIPTSTSHPNINIHKNPSTSKASIAGSASNVPRLMPHPIQSQPLSHPRPHPHPKPAIKIQPLESKVPPPQTSLSSSRRIPKCRQIQSSIAATHTNKPGRDRRDHRCQGIADRSLCRRRAISIIPRPWPAMFHPRADPMPIVLR